MVNRVLVLTNMVNAQGGGQFILIKANPTLTISVNTYEFKFIVNTPNPGVNYVWSYILIK